MDYLRINAVDRPVVIIDGSSLSKFIHPYNVTQLTKKNVLEFVTLFYEGKLRA